MLNVIKNDHDVKEEIFVLFRDIKWKKFKKFEEQKDSFCR
jgi:hypothetical protein